MRTPIDMMLDSVEWKPCDPPAEPTDLPYATHTGVLKFGEFALECVVLSNGQRIFTAESLRPFFEALGIKEAKP